jgi:S1-C subfamily serine protease
MKIELLFNGGARAGERVELQDTDLIRIGRHPDNDVVFDPLADLNVSGHHAEIRREADGYYLYDMGSSNGTFVAGDKIDRVRLASGQQIVFGPDGPGLSLRFVDDTDTLPAAAEGPPASSPGEAAAGALGPEPKVGARTVALMIDSALQQARQNKGISKSTVFVRSLVNQAVTRSTRRFKVLTLVLMVLLVAVVAGFVVLRAYERRVAEAEQNDLRQEMAKLMERQRSASSAEKQRLAQKLEQLNRTLAETKPALGGRAIVQKHMRAVFLLAYEQPERKPQSFCTAFAIRRRIVGTNAHCVIALERFRRQGWRTYAVMNRSPSRRYKVVRVAHHPGYHKPLLTISQDVGVLELDSDLPVMARLASAEDIRQLEAGDIVYMYGFPGRLSDVSAPAATLVQGVVGRLTKLDGKFGSFADNLLLQHSAFTSGGTSGSPIFNQEGKVIAVNTGGYVEPGSLQILDPSTGRAGNVLVTKQLAGYNFGIRVDALEGLLADLGK